MSRELDYANAARDILRQQGKVYLGYITAEFEPYSAQQKPDISFVPDRGPNSGKVFFIELRLLKSHWPLRDLPSALREHKAFAIEAAECDYAGFAFATNARLPPATIRQLAESGIRYLGPVDSPETLARKISTWASEGGQS